MTYAPLAAVSRIQQLTVTLSDLGTALSNAAPDGDFGAVLSQVSAEMSSLGGGAPATPTSIIGPPPVGQAVQAAFLAPPAASSSQEATVGAPSGEAVVADAEQYLGVPYRWGGTDPATGFDCSGLVQKVYSDLGVSLPRTSQEQATVGTPVPDLAQAQPGDLVFFEPSSSGPGHVGIYIGNGQMIDAPHTGTDVRIEAVGSPVAIRRVLPTAAAGTVMAAGGSDPRMSELGAPASLQPLFAAAGSRYGVDPLLLAAVAKQESGFNPAAVSSAGAEGLMQLMPATAAGLGVSAFDPASAVDGAAQLLSGYLHDYAGSVPLALAAYNAGPAAVASYGGVPPYAETEGYVSNITSMLAGAQSADQ